MTASSSSSSSFKSLKNEDSGYIRLFLSLTPDQATFVEFVQQGILTSSISTDVDIEEITPVVAVPASATPPILPHPKPTKVGVCYTPPIITEGHSANSSDFSLHFKLPPSASESSETSSGTRRNEITYSPIKEGYVLQIVDGSTTLLSVLEQYAIHEIRPFAHPNTVICRGMKLPHSLSSSVIKIVSLDDGRTYEFAWPLQSHFLTSRGALKPTPRFIAEKNVAVIFPNNEEQTTLFETYPVRFRYSVGTAIRGTVSYQLNGIFTDSSREYGISRAKLVIVVTPCLKIVNDSSTDFKNISQLAFVEDTEYIPTLLSHSSSSSSSTLTYVSDRSSSSSSSSYNVEEESSPFSSSSSSSSLPPIIQRSSHQRVHKIRKERGREEEERRVEDDTNTSNDEELEKQLQRDIVTAKAFDYPTPKQTPINFKFPQKKLMLSKNSITDVALETAELAENYLVYHFTSLTPQIPNEKFAASPCLWMRNADINNAMKVKTSTIRVEIFGGDPDQSSIVWSTQIDPSPLRAPFISRLLQNNSRNVFIEIDSQLSRDELGLNVLYNAYNFNCFVVIVGMAVSPNSSSNFIPTRVTQVKESRPVEGIATSSRNRSDQFRFTYKTLPPSIEEINDYPWKRSIPKGEFWQYFYLPAASHDLTDRKKIFPGFCRFIGSFQK